MKYHQLTSGERYVLSALRKQGLSQAAIARAMRRHPSTISRELRRNARQKANWYRPSDAEEKTRGRRRRSRRNMRFTPADLALVRACLELLWSPEQIAGRLREEGLLHISHETIYRYIWEDRRCGGSLYLRLRGARKQKWKRYRSYDSRGRMAGKRHISERPDGAENRSRVGHLEGDTVLGSFDHHCVLTLVDRKTGYVMIGKLPRRTRSATTRRAV
jgi:transposase, IS30 family